MRLPASVRSSLPRRYRAATGRDDGHRGDVLARPRTAVALLVPTLEFGALAFRRPAAVSARLSHIFAAAGRAGVRPGEGRPHAGDAAQAPGTDKWTLDEEPPDVALYSPLSWHL